MKRLVLIALLLVPAWGLLGAGLPENLFKPDSHSQPNWDTLHSKAARDDMATCGNCHARDFCGDCHGTDLAGLDRLPAAIDANDWPLAHGPGFSKEHGTAAASGSLDCMACHTPGFCTDCHESGTKPGFHPRNFITRHAAEAFARDTECSACHSTEVFCRDCHLQAGLSPLRVKNISYHDAQPFWLLGHGTAARQDLETCASCHQQTDCMQCHSVRTGWHVNPHGPDWDEERVEDRAKLMCAQCHFGDPGGD